MTETSPRPTMTTPLRTKTVLLAALVMSAAHPPVRAGWYAENTEDGADLVTMELRYPRWPKGLYFSCWNMRLLPQGGSFYGGVQSRARSDSAADQDAFRPPTTWSFWSDPDKYGGGDVLRNVFMHPEVYASLGVQYGGESTSGGWGAAPRRRCDDVLHARQECERRMERAARRARRG